MIKTFHDLWDAISALENPVYPETKLRVYLNGRYVIEKVTESQDDGAIVLWLDERGEQEE